MIFVKTLTKQAKVFKVTDRIRPFWNRFGRKRQRVRQSERGWVPAIQTFKLVPRIILLGISSGALWFCLGSSLERSSLRPFHLQSSPQTKQCPYQTKPHHCGWSIPQKSHPGTTHWGFRHGPNTHLTALCSVRWLCMAEECWFWSSHQYRSW